MKESIKNQIIMILLLSVYRKIYIFTKEIKFTYLIKQIGRLPFKAYIKMVKSRYL
jgi:hypothetical protein